MFYQLFVGRFLFHGSADDTPWVYIFHVIELIENVLEDDLVR